MAGELAGLDVIQQWAAKLGIPIDETVKKALLLMRSDPTAMHAGADAVSNVGKGVSTSQQEVYRAGTDVLAGSSGQYAQAFAPFHSELVDHMGTTATGAANFATDLHNIASTHENCQRTVVVATGATAAALSMLQA